METRKLPIIETFAEGLAVGMKHLPSLFLTTLLYVLTLWIPYLNVGTTIAMTTLPGRLAEGKPISPLFIFDGRYRKDICSFLLLLAFVYLATYMAALFLLVPAMVVSIAMSLAFYILADDGVTPTEAIRLSNRATYGNKWRIFIVDMLLGALVTGVLLLIVLLTHKVLPLCIFLAVVLVLVAEPLEMGIRSVVYDRLYRRQKPSEDMAAETASEPEA